MALSAEEIQALMGTEQPTAATPSAADATASPDSTTGFIPTLTRPFSESFKYLQGALGEGPESSLPIQSLATLAFLAFPPTRNFAIRTLLGEAAGSQFGGKTGEVIGGLAGGFAGPGLLSKASTLAGKVPFLSQLIQRLSKTATKSPEISEALGMSAKEAAPTIEVSLKDAAELAKGRMGAELIQPVASVGPASVSTATAGSQEASKFINMIRQQPDLRHTLFQPGALDETMKTVLPLFQKGESAENVFTQLYGRGAIAKEAVTTATARASEFTKFMDIASTQLNAAGANRQKIQETAGALAQQGQKAEDIFKTIFGGEAPGIPFVSGAR